MLSPRDTWVRETRPHSRGMARGGCQQKGPAVALKAVTGGSLTFKDSRGVLVREAFMPNDRRKLTSYSRCYAKGADRCVDGELTVVQGSTASHRLRAPGGPVKSHSSKC